MTLRLISLGLLFGPFAGCQLIPDVSHQPVIHNPFPQLSRVAVAPFFNLTDEETVDGRQFALAYYAELQDVPGFEVVPLSVVEEAMRDHRVLLDGPIGPAEARKLAVALGVDAVVIGAITDYSPYYPPRCGLRVEWYAANPGFHEIPPGYGLPWGTPEEEFIPAPLVFEAEMALAREQMKTQSPACDGMPASAVPGGYDQPMDLDINGEPTQAISESDPFVADDAVLQAQAWDSQGRAPDGAGEGPVDYGQAGIGQEGLPPGWPDERGFIPPGPSCERPMCVAQNGPVMTHTRIFHGADGEFSEALASYYHFRDDARFGGWQSYLQRSDDFIRFCCHLHISEMLSARGGAGETRVVWRWSEDR